MSDESRKKLEKLVEGIVSQAKNAEGAKNSLAFLFPKIEKAINTYAPNSLDENVRRLRRSISMSDFSENYFTLTPQMNAWGKTEIEELFKKGAEETFRTFRRRISFSDIDEQSDLRKIFIELLDAEFSSRKEMDEEWLAALVSESPSLIAYKDEEAKFLFHVDNIDRLRWLLQNALKKLPQERRAELLQFAIKGASDLSLLTDFVRGIGGDLRKEGSQREKESRASPGHEIENVRASLTSRIRSLAKDGELWSQAKPEFLLWYWWGVTTNDEVKDFTRQAMDTPDGLIALLTIAPNLVRSTSGDYERVSPTWEKIVDLNELNKRAESLLQSNNRSNDDIARRFITAYRKGQSDPF